MSDALDSSESVIPGTRVAATSEIWPRRRCAAKAALQVFEGALQRRRVRSDYRPHGRGPILGPKQHIRPPTRPTIRSCSCSMSSRTGWVRRTRKLLRHTRADGSNHLDRSCVSCSRATKYDVMTGGGSYFKISGPAFQRANARRPVAMNSPVTSAASPAPLPESDPAKARWVIPSPITPSLKFASAT